MHVVPICFFIFVTLSWKCVTVTGDDLGNSSNIRKSLIQMAKNKTYNPAINGRDNPFLNQFLDNHSKVKINLDVNHFNLVIDDRYEFQPSIVKAPFSSTGEPWPMPKVYTASETEVLAMDIATFNITTLDDSCNILTKAIKRYMIIIFQYTIEEHYESVLNFNENFKKQYTNTAMKYDNASKLSNLEVNVSSLDCDYPNENMDESYNLTIQRSISKLAARQVWGALRGLETFSQLLFRRMNTQQIYTKETNITDEPRFAHRGILIDTSRHFIHKYIIKNVLKYDGHNQNFQLEHHPVKHAVHASQNAQDWIEWKRVVLAAANAVTRWQDGMAYNKLNVLHWHIVDDNSFPYQSQIFPKLSEKGAYHPNLVYTLNDIRDIVEYARLRGIRIIPEFDTPGHTFAWFGYEKIKSMCFHDNVSIPGHLGPINPAQPYTYTFMSKLFSEISEVFPDKSVHLGGDELQSTCWSTNPNIVTYLELHANISKEEAVMNPKEYVNKAVGYYFKRLITTLQRVADGKKHTNYIMWEDVLKNTKEIPLDSIMQIWMGTNMNVMKVNQLGYRALFSACWYLDNIQRDPMWMDYYKCEPSPYMTDKEEKGKLLGGEACLWAEYITTDTLMTMMWPRASAPAERLWSPRNVVDLQSAMSRLQEQRCRMIYRGLPTGHISGPDYCLRSQDGPLNGIQDVIDTQTKYTDEEDTHISSNLSFIVLSQYNHYLLLVNVVLSLIGIYVMWKIIQRIQRR